MCASLGCYRWFTFLRKGKRSVVQGRESEHPPTKMANTEIQSGSPQLCVAMCQAPSCLTLCNPMNCSLPGSSVQGISQPRILKWVAISSSPGPGIEPEFPVSPASAGGFFTTEPPGKPPRSQESMLNHPQNGGLRQPSIVEKSQNYSSMTKMKSFL